MLLNTLDASLFGNLLTGKGIKSEIPRPGVIKANKVKTRGSQDF